LRVAVRRPGSLVTANVASSDLGGNVSAVPGPVNSRLAAGPNELLAEGAYLVRDAHDVLEALAGSGLDGSDAYAPLVGQQG
jgi:DNA processing protein